MRMLAQETAENKAEIRNLKVDNDLKTTAFSILRSSLSTLLQVSDFSFIYFRASSKDVVSSLRGKAKKLDKDNKALADKVGRESLRGGQYDPYGGQHDPYGEGREPGGLNPWAQTGAGEGETHRGGLLERQRSPQPCPGGNGYPQHGSHHAPRGIMLRIMPPRGA